MPQTYNIKYIDGVQTSIAGVVDEQFINEVVYDGETYRDTLDASFVGVFPPIAGPPTKGASTLGQLSTVNDIGDTNNSSFSLSSQLVVPLDGAESANNTAATNPTAYQASDEYTHTAPRFRAKTRTRATWWDTAAIYMSSATVNTSLNVTVASTATLAVGMRVFGAGIPANARIASITSGTVFVLTIAATATATVPLMYLGGNLLGWAWLDEIAGISIGTHSYIG